MGAAHGFWMGLSVHGLVVIWGLGVLAGPSGSGFLRPDLLGFGVLWHWWGLGCSPKPPLDGRPHSAHRPPSPQLDAARKLTHFVEFGSKLVCFAEGGCLLKVCTVNTAWRRGEQQNSTLQRPNANNPVNSPAWEEN
eukprot:s1586_g12.t1